LSDTRHASHGLESGASCRRPDAAAGSAEAWFRELERRIEDGEGRAQFVARIRRSFSHPDWKSAAMQFFEAAPA
jgi:hypothetical protein